MNPASDEAPLSMQARRTPSPSARALREWNNRVNKRQRGRWGRDRVPLTYEMVCLRLHLQQDCRRDVFQFFVGLCGGQVQAVVWGEGVHVTPLLRKSQPKFSR